MRRLYDMRSLLVHRASPVAPAITDPGGGWMSRYPTRDGKYVGYACFLAVNHLTRVFRRALWRRINDQEP